MNIEESKAELNLFINSIKSDLQEDAEDNFRTAQAIETLLTAYEKEKGENVKLRLQDIPFIEGEIKAYKDRVNELKQELEKEKEKNKELSNSYDKLAKECNEENRRCMLLAVENQDLKKKNKKIENDLKDIIKKYMEAESVKFWYNYIHKDKIRKMLQELEDRRNKQPVIGYWSKKAMLEKLLKEE